MSALWLLLLVFFPRVAGSSPLIPYYAPLAIFFLSSVTVKKKYFKGCGGAVPPRNIVIPPEQPPRLH